MPCSTMFVGSSQPHHRTCAPSHRLVFAGHATPHRDALLPQDCQIVWHRRNSVWVLQVIRSSGTPCISLAIYLLIIDWLVKVGALSLTYVWSYASGSRAWASLLSPIDAWLGRHGSALGPCGTYFTNTCYLIRDYPHYFYLYLSSRLPSNFPIDFQLLKTSFIILLTSRHRRRWSRWSIEEDSRRRLALYASSKTDEGIDEVCCCC